MAACKPSVNITLTASDACSRTSLTVSSCAFLNCDSTYLAPSPTAMIRANTQPDARELLRTQRTDNRLHAVMSPPSGLAGEPARYRTADPTRRTAAPDLLPAGLVLAYKLAHRSAAQVHEGFRLGQHHFVSGDACSRRLRSAVTIVHANAALLGDAIHRQETHVVRCELVFDARIAEPTISFTSLTSSSRTSLPWRPCRPRQLRPRLPCPS